MHIGTYSQVLTSEKYSKQWQTLSFRYTTSLQQRKVGNEQCKTRLLAFLNKQSSSQRNVAILQILNTWLHVLTRFTTKPRRVFTPRLPRVRQG